MSATVQYRAMLCECGHFALYVTQTFHFIKAAGNGRFKYVALYRDS
jgi:hypothetical protein